jgi:hypothetical protein
VEGFDQSADVVLGGFLPRHATVLGDGLQVLITLRRIGFGVRTEHRRGPGRHDHGRVRMTPHCGLGHIQD